MDRALDPVAKKSYVDKIKKSHKKFNATDSGLTLHNLKPFIGASADLEISCDCCDIGLCEIKCPETIKNESPTEDNLAYVKNGKVNENHQYFYQIQGQMGILQRGYCDLFIFTFHGNMTVRVLFQEEFWSTVFNKLCWFLTNFIIPEVLKPTVDSENTESETESESGTEKQPVTRFLDYNNNTAVPTCGIASAPTKSKQKQKNKRMQKCT